MHRRGLVVATTVSMLGPLVPFLVGALAVTLRSELAMTSAGIGLAIACFFVASAVASIPAGRMIERVGAGRSTAIAGGLNGIALMAMSTLVHGQGSLIGAMAAAGVGNAIAHPAVNAAIAGRVDSRNHGLILGLKQAAVPGALVIAGLTVPLSLTLVPWRTLVGVMAAVGIGLAAASSREASTTRAVYRSLSWDSTLVLLGVASAAGIAAMNGGAAFLVGFGVHRGWTNEMSGWLLVVGSVLGLCARIAVGRLADRIGFDPLRLVAVLMSLGAIGALAMIGSATFPGAVVLMCAAGWGWPGLMHLAVLRSHGDTPAAATGVVEVGTYLGGGIGPAVFGLAIDSGSFELGWLIMGTIGLGAALMLWLAPRILDR